MFMLGCNCVVYSEGVSEVDAMVVVAEVVCNGGLRARSEVGQS